MPRVSAIRLFDLTAPQNRYRTSLQHCRTCYIRITYGVLYVAKESGHASNSHHVYYCVTCARRKNIIE